MYIVTALAEIGVIFAARHNTRCNTKMPNDHLSQLASLATTAVNAAAASTSVVATSTDSFCFSKEDQDRALKFIEAIMRQGTRNSAREHQGIRASW